MHSRPYCFMQHLYFGGVQQPSKNQRQIIIPTLPHRANHQTQNRQRHQQSAMAVPVRQRAAHHPRESGHLRRLQTPGEAGRQIGLWLARTRLCRAGALRLSVRTGHAPPFQLVQHPLWWQPGMVPLSYHPFCHRHHALGLGTGLVGAGWGGGSGVVVVPKCVGILVLLTCFTRNY
jgi:hypothetical protein